MRIIFCASLLTLVLSPLHALAENFGNVSPEDGARVTRWGDEMTYSWVHEERNGSRLRLSTSLVFQRGWQYMQDVYRSIDHGYTAASRFVVQDPFRADLNVLAGGIRQIASEHGLRDVDVALSFVQSLPYQEVEGYQRYSVEVLIDGKGDCSETAVLLAGLMEALGYSTVFLAYTSHLAVGVWGGADETGTYFLVSGRRYFYCESTGLGFPFGQAPDKYQHTPADIEIPG